MEGIQENNKNSVVPSRMTALSRDQLHGFSSQTNLPNRKHKNVVLYEEDENGELELKLRLDSMDDKLPNSSDVGNVTGGWRGKAVESMEGREQNAGNVNVLLPSSQGSIELQRRSGFSELLRQQIEGARRIREVTNPFVPPSPPPLQAEQVPVIRACENANELVRTTLLDMPHVTTKGLDGNKIEGLLYKYQKADDIKIVCVCHGYFLSPAEFIKHAGGGDVEYPLRHIVVLQKD